MISLRHISLVCKGDIDTLKNFYKLLLQPTSIIEIIEEGEELDQIIGIKNVKILTCKLLSKNLNIELIKYIKPKAISLNKKDSSFTGLNHIALNVDNFNEMKDLILKNGGSCDSHEIRESKNPLVRFVRYMRDPEGNILEIVEMRK